MTGTADVKAETTTGADFNKGFKPQTYHVNKGQEVGVNTILHMNILITSSPPWIGFPSFHTLYCLFYLLPFCLPFSSWSREKKSSDLEHCKIHQKQRFWSLNLSNWTVWASWRHFPSERRGFIGSSYSYSSGATSTFEASVTWLLVAPLLIMRVSWHNGVNGLFSSWERFSNALLSIGALWWSSTPVSELHHCLMLVFPVWHRWLLSLLSQTVYLPWPKPVRYYPQMSALLLQMQLDCWVWGLGSSVLSHVLVVLDLMKAQPG